MSWRRTTETSWRRSIKMLLGVSFETQLRRRWDVQRDVVTTSPRRFVAGWEHQWRKQQMELFKNILWITDDYTDNLKRRKEIYHGNS